MKNAFFILLLFVFSCNSIPKKSSSDEFFMPAEYASHDAIWLGWIEYQPYYQPFIDIAKALYSKVPLKIIVNSEQSLDQVKRALSSEGIDVTKITFFTMVDNRLWMRDHGATYLMNKKGEKAVADFGWTMYGRKDALKIRYNGNQDSVNYHYQKQIGKTGSIDSLMGAREGHSTIKTDVNMEGGSIEVNGKGTLILCEAVTFQRNPNSEKSYIESEFKRVLGVSNIIWMQQGLAEDPYHFNQIFDNYYGWGTFGHTDEFVRFANDSTILLAWVDEDEKDDNRFNQMNFERMSENLTILQKAKDQDGNPFKIIKVPLPDPLYLPTTVTNEESDIDWSERDQWQIPLPWFQKKGTMEVGDSINWVAASSYLNYLVSNDVVLLPSYTKEGSSVQKEEDIKEIFSNVFPNRELIFLNVMNLNYHGGGIHCVTQQEPKSNSN